ncbi:6-bladed beta-propeller [Marivirga sp.]|uniref:6-bladed beta-propeller n=1 Tax=Marivirga sp. TaxID=2018662 RepID=UPI003DA737C2
MMNNYNYVLAFIFFILSCCNVKEVPENELVIKVKDDILDNINYSELISDIEFIKLDENPDAIITQIDKILFHNNKIYILQRFFNPRVLVFENNGKYLYDLGKEGDGPGEYMYPYDLLVNNDTIELLVANFIYSYKENNGKYIGSKSIGFPAVRFKKTSDGYVFKCGGDEKEIFITDNETNVLSKNMDKGIRNEINPLISFHPQNDNLLFHMTLNDTIFQIQNNKLTPFRIINFEKPLTDEVLNNLYHRNNSSISELKKNMGDYMGYLKVYVENESHIYFTYMHKNQNIAFLYDKRKKEGWSIDPSEIKNNVTFEGYAPFIMDTYNNTFVGYISYPHSSIEIPNGEIKNDISEKLMRELNSEKINVDNPILFKLKFK